MAAPAPGRDRLRVALVHGPAPPSRDGVSDYVEHLARALGAAGVEAEAVAVHQRPGGWAAGVVAAARRVRRLGPDLVHVQFAPSAFRFSGIPGCLPLLLPRGVPLVTTVHEYGGWSVPHWVPAAVWRAVEGRGLWDREAGRLVPASAAVVVTNAGHAEAVRRRTGRDPVVIPLAPNVEPGCPDPGPALRAAVRRRLGLAPDAFLLVFFGFVHPVKGVRYVLEALPGLRARYPGLHLAVVGGFTSQALPQQEADAFRAELEALATRCRVTDAVTFTGYLPPSGVRDVLHAADAGVLPFTAGVTAKSGALLALLAHGLPTAVTVPDEPDPLLRDDDTVAVIAGRRDAAAIAETLTRLIEDGDLRRRLGHSGAALVASRSWPDVAAAHCRLYDRLVREPS